LITGGNIANSVKTILVQMVFLLALLKRKVPEVEAQINIRHCEYPPGDAGRNNE
jgi:hypothetical protein